jgi:hypothetical protein
MSSELRDRRVEKINRVLGSPCDSSHFLGDLSVRSIRGSPSHSFVVVGKSDFDQFFAYQRATFFGP